MRIKHIALTIILFWGLISCDKNPDTSNSKEIIVTKAKPVDFVKTFEGQINNKYNIHMKVTSNNGNINGKYFYTKVGEELEIKGTIDDQGKVKIFEYDSNGNQTGIFDGEMYNENKIEGFWSKPNGSSSMPFYLLTNNINYETTQRDVSIEKFQGTYTSGTNQLLVTVNNSDEIDIKLHIANQDCAMPSYIGKLSKAADNRFSGKVRSEFDDYANESYNLTIKFKGDIANVNSNDSREEWSLGAACGVEGTYEK